MVYLDTVAGNGREICHTFIDPMGSIFVLSSAWPTHPTATTGWGPHDHNTSLRWRFAPSRLMQTLFKSIRPLGRPWELKQDIYNPGQWRAVEPPKITKFYPKIIWTKPSLLCSMLIFRSVSWEFVRDPPPSMPCKTPGNSRPSFWDWNKESWCFSYSFSKAVFHDFATFNGLMLDEKSTGWEQSCLFELLICFTRLLRVLKKMI